MPAFVWCWKTGSPAIGNVKMSIDKLWKQAIEKGCYLLKWLEDDLSLLLPGSEHCASVATSKGTGLGQAESFPTGQWCLSDLMLLLLAQQYCWNAFNYGWREFDVSQEICMHWCCCGSWSGQKLGHGRRETPSPMNIHNDLTIDAEVTKDASDARKALSSFRFYRKACR